jgi:hypothetical protein
MIRVENHLILPFGRSSCESHRIRLVGSSTQEMLLESESPCLYINRSNLMGVTLKQFAEAFPSAGQELLEQDPEEYLQSMSDLLRTHCELQTSYEHLFVTLYFDALWEAHKGDGAALAGSLMPLPQTHMYLTDFSNLISGQCEQKCLKVDFAFWTGQRFVAVRLDGRGERDDRNDERLLRFWGIELVRISEDDVSAAAVRRFVGPELLA